MERFNTHSGVDCHLPKEEAPEMTLYILKPPDLTREVVLKDLDDPPIPLSEDDGSDPLLNHFFSPGTILHILVPARECPARGSRLG
jgi:hypothetical protein